MKQQTADREPLISTHGNSERVRYPSVGALVLIWAFIGAASSLRGFLSYPHVFKSDFAFWVAYVACYLPWGFFTAFIFRLEERFPLDGERWPRNAAILALASLPISALAAPTMRLSFAGTLRLLGQPASFSRPLSHLLYELLIGEFFFWLSVTGAYSIRTHFQLQQQRERAMQLISTSKSRRSPKRISSRAI